MRWRELPWHPALMDVGPVARPCQRSHCLLRWPHPILHNQAERPFALDKALFLNNFKRGRRGAAAGPSGATEHLKSVLSDSRDAERLFSAGLLLPQANIPRRF